MTNRKKKVLVVGDKTMGNTGFATYKKELLTGLFKSNKYEVAEFAFAGLNSEKPTVPWIYYPCSAVPGEPDYEMFQQNQFHNKNGKWRWEPMLLHFRPDVVISVQDPWQIAYQAFSPLRKFYKFITAAPVDSHPQKSDYLQIYNAADCVIPYTEYARNVLTKAGLKNVLEPIPMGVDTKIFKKMKKDKIREAMQIDKDALIFGMVARNQPRKRIPELMRAFRDFLNKAPKEIADKSYLYLHTTYTDMIPWDLTRNLLENNLTHKVLFTYVCAKTKKIFASFFREGITYSPLSHEMSGVFLNMSNAPPFEDLAKVYNCFDLYIQYANAEGFGVPIVEAASCEVPVVGVDYSAHGEVVRKVGGDVIAPPYLEEDFQVHSRRAVMPYEKMVQYFLDFSENKTDNKTTRQNVLNNYSWKKIIASWMNVINEETDRSDWSSPRTEIIPAKIEGNVTPSTLITEITDQLPWRYSDRVLNEMKEFMHGGTNSVMGHKKIDINSLVKKYNEIYKSFVLIEDLRTGKQELPKYPWLEGC